MKRERPPSFLVVDVVELPLPSEGFGLDLPASDFEESPVITLKSSKPLAAALGLDVAVAAEW